MPTSKVIPFYGAGSGQGGPRPAPSQGGARPRGREKGRALVLADGWRLQYRTLDCAAVCFDEVHVAGTRKAKPLAWSAKCRSFSEIGGANAGRDQDSVARVNGLCASLGIDLVLPSDAETTEFLAAFRDRIHAPCFPGPDAATFRLLNNKHRFTSLCAELGVPTPRTTLVSCGRELAGLLAADALRFPLVAKPLEMWGGFGVQVFGPDAPLQAVDSIQYEPILVQEYVDGSDLCAFYFCRGGRIEAEAVYEAGRSAVRFLKDDRIRAASEAVIRHCAFDGVIGFDVRRGADGRIAYLECNPRFWYNMDLTMLAGLNFVEIGARREAGPRSFPSLEGRAVPRARGLFRRGWSAEARERVALARHVLSDVPMAAIAVSNAGLRKLGLFDRPVRDAAGRLLRGPEF